MIHTASVSFKVELGPGHPGVTVKVEANPLRSERRHRRRRRPRNNRSAPPQQEAQRVESRPAPALPRAAAARPFVGKR